MDPADAQLHMFEFVEPSVFVFVFVYAFSFVFGFHRRGVVDPADAQLHMLPTS